MLYRHNVMINYKYSYVPLTKSTIYSKLNNNKIYYNDGKNTNLLNDAIVTNEK